MNAGRDVERLITSWLVEEAAPGAPDRVLESTRQVVRRTNQRRFAAIWRESMFTPARLGAIAALLVIALGTGFWIGRATSVSGPAAPAAPAATPTPSSGSDVTLETYRAARNALCHKYVALVGPLNAKLSRIYDPTLPAADRAIEVQALTDIATEVDLLVTELEALEPPASIAGAHVAQLANYRQVISLMRQEFPLITAGDYAGAQTLDNATSPVARDIERFEAANSLDPCP